MMHYSEGSVGGWRHYAETFEGPLKAVSATAMHQFKTHPPILLIFVL